MTFDVKALNEVDRKAYESLLPNHPNLGLTTWTPAQVKALDKAHDEHIDYCEECLAEDTPEPEDHSHCYANPNEACFLTDYCPAGKKTFRAWLDADLEYRWQLDFDPDWCKNS